MQNECYCDGKYKFSAYLGQQVNVKMMVRGVIRRSYL